MASSEMPIASEPSTGLPGPATLYVIHGSHACAAAKLMLGHKGIPFRTVTLPTGLHPQLVRLRGFPGSERPMRMIDGKPTRMSAMLDRIGTVPALRIGELRLQRNREIARRLEALVPEPRLFPAEASRREAVEEAEAWGDEPLQMFARRAALAAGARGLDQLSERAARGRLGPLLAGNGPQRLLAAKVAARTTFAVDDDAERRLLTELPSMLDRADSYLAAGVIGGPQPNVADMMIAPSLALLDYRLDVRPELRSRPCFAVVERLLPEPPPA
jgi:glutathione S-transferase